MWSRRRRRSAIAEAGFGPDLTLALAHAPARDRAALSALFALDAAMGDVVRTSSQPLLGAVRLAWWRERLEELDKGLVPAEPRLRDAACELRPRGITGSELAVLEGPWMRLFDDFPWDAAVTEAIVTRGGALFTLGARLLRCNWEPVWQAGQLWALADAARHCSDPASRALLIDAAKSSARTFGRTRAPRALRPLTMLAALAVRDAIRGEPFEFQGTPARAFAMLTHRLTGKIPQVAVD